MLAETFLEINILMDINIGHLMRYSTKTGERMKHQVCLVIWLLSA